MAEADGESVRFAALAAEYNRAPEVTRQRLYLETMEEVFSQVSKVIVDVKSGNNMFYLPLDELIRGRNDVKVPYRLDSDSGTGQATVVTPPDSYPSRQPDRSRGGGRG